MAYIIISPPKTTAVERSPELARRIYGRPIVMRAKLSNERVVEAVDFLWAEVLRLAEDGGKTSDGPEPLNLLADQNGQPRWQCLEEIDDLTTGFLKVFSPENSEYQTGDFGLILTQGDEGALIVVLRPLSKGFKILEPQEVEF